jgi:catechol 2,3-dioxygenase-like lactoylglutathione lyase family enzyme
MGTVGLDHLYISVSDFARSERFYDAVMERLGFRKSDRVIAGAPHAHYFTPLMQYTIRPAREGAPAHDPYAPGLHHVCLQVRDRAAVDRACRDLRQLGVAASEPRLYPEYAPDYYATFFTDPDGIRLEVVARRLLREEIARDWDRFDAFLNPVARLRERDGETESQT